jgi:arylsulfatase A-like enzyme
MKWSVRMSLALGTIAALYRVAGAPMVKAQEKKPNIVVIMSDDVGIWNISAYHRGMMGGRTPNIDRIANEGALFTDYYAQQSCTAGRAAFILGQTPFRTGLLKVGLPAAKQGLQNTDPTIAELLKPLGYATAQIGKNRLGDRNEYLHLPTLHGFDEFYGILYHLNAMEEPYEGDYPKRAGFREQFGPRNIVDCQATAVDDATTDPRWGRVGKQTIADGGPLPPHPNMDPTAKVNMEEIEPELVRRSTDFMDRSVKAGKPFFPLAQFHTRPCVDTSFSEMGEQERLRPLCRCRDGTGLGGRRDS